MREEMKLNKEALLAVGHKGNLSPFGFTTDEIVEVIEEEEDFRDMAKKCEPIQTTAEERVKIMIGDGVIGEEQAWRKRCDFLKREYEEASRRYFEAKYQGDDDKELEAIKNRKKFDYEVESYRPEYDKKHFLPEEVERADSVDIDKFIKPDGRGFVCCPFHKEKTPSMHITKNKFYCFGCGEKGKAISFLMKYQSKSFKEAVELLLKYY